MAAQPQQSQNDNSMAPVWITILLFITAYFIWYFAHEHIVKLVFLLTIAQAKLVQLFLGSGVLSEQIYQMQTLPPEAVHWKEMTDMLAQVGAYTRYPYIIILCVLAFYLYQSNIKLKFKKAHDMKTLRAQEQYNWKAIMPIIKLDLVSQNISEGPWAMALNPIEFGRKHDLLRKEDALLDNPLPGQEMTAGIRKGDAKRVFTIQLGPYWDGFDKLSPHAYALAAVFAARMNRDRGAATMILETIDKTSVAGKPDFSVAKSVMKKYQNSELVQDIVAKHAYALTVMISMLEGARADGVVPSSEFLWLKPIDRRLWYVLNCVGRQTPYPEVGGPFAHWKAEKALKRRSLVPMIDEAIKALEVAVKEVKLSPKELQGLTL